MEPSSDDSYTNESLPERSIEAPQAILRQGVAFSLEKCRVALLILSREDPAGREGGRGISWSEVTAFPKNRFR